MKAWAAGGGSGGGGGNSPLVVWEFHHSFREHLQPLWTPRGGVGVLTSTLSPFPNLCGPDIAFRVALSALWI